MQECITASREGEVSCLGWYSQWRKAEQGDWYTVWCSTAWGEQGSDLGTAGT